MQLPETPPPPLAALWDRVLRARALPPDLDVQLLYVAIRDRLTHPEWEVRLHALRVLADLLPLSKNALSFPFDQVIDNLGHNSPNVRKAALDALKVFCTHCEDPECAARSILDKCSYNNIRPHSADFDMKVNVITGLILSIPSVMAILKRRYRDLDLLPIFKILGDKLFDSIHRDVALRSLMKLRRICSPRDYMMFFSRLDSKVQDKFRFLCELYDEDSLDVYYAPRKVYYRDNDGQMVKINQVFNGTVAAPLRLSTDTSSEDSYSVPFNSNNFAKVIIETEIKFDSDTAITMTVLEQNETESEKNTGSDDEGDNSDRFVLKYSDGESEEDSDVVVKKVRFGGESVKIRTPDSDNLLTSEDDNNQNAPTHLEKSDIGEILPETPSIVGKLNEIKREALERESRTKSTPTTKKSGIPLPVIHNKSRAQQVTSYNNVKLKSKSLSELYDYFNKKSDGDGRPKESSGFALTLTEVRSPEKVPSPVEPHREVEVLHNLQRSPTISPRRQQTPVQIERDRFVLDLVASTNYDAQILSPRPPSPLRARYDWEDIGLVPKHVSDQLHNTENWIAAVKAADQLHSTLLEPDNVAQVEPVAESLVRHMWALSDAVSAARAPAEGAVCAVVRNGSSHCIRQLLPTLLARAARDPPPAALPHALLQRLALHHLVDLIFEPDMIGVSTIDSELLQDAQLRAALCLARAAGPAAVLAAVRRRLAGTHRANVFCNKLREKLNRPLENIRPSHVARASQLPIPARRRARSTPPAAPPRPRRLRPLPDSAPLPGIVQARKEIIVNPLSSVAVNESREGAAVRGGGGMRRLCCCGRAPVRPAPAATPDLVANLPLYTRDSSAVTNSGDGDEEKSEQSPEKEKAGEFFVVDGISDIGIPREEDEETRPPRTPSIQVEDFSEKSLPTSLIDLAREENSPTKSDKVEAQSQTSSNVESEKADTQSEKSPASAPAKSRRQTPDSTRSGNVSPEIAEDVKGERRPEERDVRTALAECIVPVRHEDWEVIVNGLAETERLAADAAARAPASSWRASTRSAAAHVRSLRSRVARAACSTLGALFEHRGRVLDTELEEAAGALLDRCADVNRFLRGDAANALGRVAIGGGLARAGVALVRRGATHRAGPVRAAAAQALARLVRHNGATRVLELPTEPRTVILRAAGELLGDANPETRMHARHLCLALSEDTRFRQMLKDSMPISRYRAIEKFVDKLRCR